MGTNGMMKTPLQAGSEFGLSGQCSRGRQTGRAKRSFYPLLAWLGRVGGEPRSMSCIWQCAQFAESADKSRTGGSRGSREFKTANVRTRSCGRMGIHAERYLPLISADAD